MANRAMFAAVLAVVVAIAAASGRSQAADSSADVKRPAWPEATSQCRPWSYWWWLGSAVDPANLSKELQRFRDAGWGGVHIIPIYGAKGFESRYIEYLSPRWMEMLDHVCREARRLGLGVDMTTGSGWCFGGPTITDEEANATVVAKTCKVAPGGKPRESFDPKSTQVLMAFAEDGRKQDITSRIQPDGRVDWAAPDGQWQLYGISQRPAIKVKRAAPGGEGWMLNTFFAPATRHYLVRFQDAFAQYKGLRPRAMYHDSYEYRGNWSPDLFAQFQRRRGYRLQDELPALLADDGDDRVARLKSDYRQTLAEMMDESFLPVWVDWCHKQGILTRNQAHGSPGNLLDFYAVADIPETEMFNRDRSTLASKFASSAAHVAGRRLVASETGTWLREHFTETLADVKELVDQLFLAGVNHVVYHGSCYSPDEVPWPGWLFYASTEMNSRNAIWRDVPALNAYIARCQSVLQSGKADNDLLVYWPIYDVWHNPRGMHQSFTVHKRFWIEEQPFGATAQRLYDRGFAMDFISDRQLAEATGGDAGVRVPGGTYRAVVVPPCEHVPVETLAALIRLAESGATVIFESHLPKDVPGLGRLDQRRGELATLRDRIRVLAADEGLQQAKLGKGNILVGDVETALAKAGVARESLVDQAGLQSIRRAVSGGRCYFVANRGQQAIDGWVPLAMKCQSAAIMDPWDGAIGKASVRDWQTGCQVRLQLPAGAAVIVRLHGDEQPQPPAWNYWTAHGEPKALEGRWQIEFIEGGPELPPPLETSKLASWTELGGEAAQRFAGAARYRLFFDAPGEAPDAWWLDLGRVCQSARVRLNGQSLGTLFTSPYRVLVRQLRPRGNLLEIEVTSVSANRIRDLDRRGVSWRNFHDINLVNMDYKPFDASNWPLSDCGLLGPVTLQAAAISPQAP